MNWMKYATAAFILIAPILILALDWLVYEYWGYAYTITGVVRSWSKNNPWPEFIFIISAVILYTHLFRNWPGASEFMK